MLIKWLLITLSCFHFYTAGFGLLRETTHRGVHLAFVLVLIFLVFSGSKAVSSHPVRHSLTTPGGIPWFDWLLGLGVALAVLYIPYTFEDLAFRVGNPTGADVVFGTILFVALLEATRRSMGWPLPIIALGFTVYSLFGPYFLGCCNTQAQAGASSSTTSTSPARAFTVWPWVWWPPTCFTLCCLV